MIEKMSYVSIAGPKSKFDQIMDQFLSDYEIHLENASLEMSSQKHFVPFIEDNPYKKLVSKAEEIIGDGGEELSPKAKKAAAKEEKQLRKALAGRKITKDEATALIIDLYEKLDENSDEKNKLVKMRNKYEADLETMKPFKGFEYKIEDLLKFTYVSYRFGRIPKEAWPTFTNNVEDELSNLFTRCQSDSKYIWGVYFVPENEEVKTDSVFASLRFERVDICKDYKGTPDEICSNIEAEIAKLNERLDEIKEHDDKLISDKKLDLILAKEKLEELSYNFDARKMAACIEGDGEKGLEEESFFIVCGWIRTKDAKALDKRLDEETQDVICIIDNTPEDSGLTPPTSIKNVGPFKPYEMYTKMYGLPRYNEFDPTILIALLYSFIFGAMFGDLGHGLVLLIGGAALYFWKKAQIAGIISFAGVFSCIFGLLFGSFFGFEDIIPTLWLKPREAMSNLNFVGRLNTVFAIAVAFGMILMLALMIINVLSHAKQKNIAESLFGANGIAGFVFYGSIVVVVFLYMGNKPLPATGLLLVLVIVPILLIALNEPLTNIIKKRKPLEVGVGMFLVEAFFDLFETVLNYFSNTLSFVRVGAFAVSHAAMMEVVLSLTGYEHGGHGTLIGLIAGNLFVIGFEGLIVGIQVLRLQYYEIFSKFYNGDGREFKPFFKKRRNS